MDGYTFQTHSVYRDKQSGAILLLVHHNPMALCSLLLRRTGGGRFDAAAFQETDVDAVIAMRKSARYEELDPLPNEEFRLLLKELSAHVPAAEIPLIQALAEQLPGD